MVMLNSYDIVKEAFMTRADDFADRLMNETTFMDFTDGSYNRITLLWSPDVGRS